MNVSLVPTGKFVFRYRIYLWVWHEKAITSTLLSGISKFSIILSCNQKIIKSFFSSFYYKKFKYIKVEGISQ